MLSAERLIEAWESSRHVVAARRGPSLLAAWESNASPEDLLDAPMEVVNRGLLQRCPGARAESIPCVADCPECGVGLEFEFPRGAALAQAGSPDPFLLECEGWELNVRAPSYRDLEAAAGAGSVEAAERTLVQRCVRVHAAPGGAPGGDAMEAVDLPEEVLGAVSEELYARNPLVQLRVSLTCVGCDASWTGVLEPAEYLFTGVNVRARGLLHEVHALARNYGWSESEILGLSADRRRLYLEMSEAR